VHCRVGDLNEAVIALRLRVWMLRIRAPTSARESDLEDAVRFVLRRGRRF